jgi:hypothetical protein
MKSSPALAALNISKSNPDPAKQVSDPVPPQLQLPPQISISVPATSAMSDQDRRVRDRALAAEDATKKQRQLEAAAHAQDTLSKKNALSISANTHSSSAGHLPNDFVVHDSAPQDEPTPYVESRTEGNRSSPTPYEGAKEQSELGFTESSAENQAVERSISTSRKSGLPLSPPSEPSDLAQQAPEEANCSGLLAGRSGIPTNAPPVHLSGFGGATGLDEVTQDERDRARRMVEEFLRSRQMLPNVSELQAAHPPAGSTASVAINSTLHPPSLGHEQMLATNANGEEETDEVFCFDSWPHSNARREAAQPKVSNPSPEPNESWVIPGLAETSAQQGGLAAWGLAGPPYGDTPHGGMGRTIPFDPFRPFPDVSFPQFQNGPGINNMDGLLMRGNSSGLPGFLGGGGLGGGGVDGASFGLAGGAPLSTADFSGAMPWPPPSLHGPSVGAQELSIPPWAHSKGGGGGGPPQWAGEPFRSGPFGAGPPPQGPLSGGGGAGGPPLAPRTDQTASDALKSLLGIMPSAMTDVTQRMPAQVLPVWADVTADPAIAQIIKPPPAPAESTAPRPVASTSLPDGIGSSAAGGGAPAARSKAIKDPNASAGGRPPAGSSAENRMRSTVAEGGGGGGGGRSAEARPVGGQGPRAAAGEGRRTSAGVATTGATDPGAAKSSGGQVLCHRPV